MLVSNIGFSFKIEHTSSPIQHTIWITCYGFLCIVVAVVVSTYFLSLSHLLHFSSLSQWIIGVSCMWLYYSINWSVFNFLTYLVVSWFSKNKLNMKSEPLIITEFVLKTHWEYEFVCVRLVFFPHIVTLLWPFSVVCECECAIDKAQKWQKCSKLKWIYFCCS